MWISYDIKIETVIKTHFKVRHMEYMSYLSEILFGSSYNDTSQSMSILT